MPRFNKQLVTERLAPIAFSPGNRKFIDYWLSCHADDGRFKESDLPAADIARITHAMVTADVKPGRSVVVTRVGDGIAALLSYNLVGADLIEMLPAHLRPIRLERTSEIARGVMAHNLQRVVTDTREFAWEEVLAPFGEMTQAGTRPVVTHIDLTVFKTLPRAIDERVIRPAELFRPIPLDFQEEDAFTE